MYVSRLMYMPAEMVRSARASCSHPCQICAEEPKFNAGSATDRLSLYCMCYSTEIIGQLPSTQSRRASFRCIAPYCLILSQDDALKSSILTSQRNLLVSRMYERESGKLVDVIVTMLILMYIHQPSSKPDSHVFL